MVNKASLLEKYGSQEAVSEHYRNLGKAKGYKLKPLTHCPNGHKYTPENTTYLKRGTRACRVCQRDRVKIYRQKNK